jgi:hypothetical protein
MTEPCELHGLPATAVPIDRRLARTINASAVPTPHLARRTGTKGEPIQFDVGVRAAPPSPLFR